MTPDEIARKYGKVAEFNGVDRPPTGIHRNEHEPTPSEQLRLIHQTGDPSGQTDPYDGAFFGLNLPAEDGSIDYE